jgi:hypothetical protein
MGRAAPADVPAELDAQLDAIRRAVEGRDRAFKALQSLASVTIEIIIEHRGVDLTLGWSLDDRHVTEEHQLASAKVGAVLKAAIRATATARDRRDRS